MNNEKLLDSKIEKSPEKNNTVYPFCSCCDFFSFFNCCLLLDGGCLLYAI